MSSPGSSRRTSVIILFTAFLLTGLFAIRNLATWPARITYPGEESYEGVALVEMAHLRRGIPIYNPPSSRGFADATYGPLYYILGSHLINPSHPSYLPLRLLSAFGMLALAAGCGLLAFWLTRSYAAALLSPLIFLSYGMVTQCGIKALSDAIALLFFFSGFLVAYRFRNTRAVLFATPLMLLGFYYKPQYIAGPVAVLVFLVLEKRFRLAIQFAGLLAFGGLGLLVLFQWVVFPGQAFWHHFLLYQGSFLSSFFTWLQFQRAFLTFAVALFLPVPLLYIFDHLRSNGDRLLSCYLVSAALLGFFTFFKDGSNIQYFLEPVLLISSLLPVLLVRVASEARRAVAIILVIGLTVVAGQYDIGSAPRQADVAQYDALESFLRHNFPRTSPVLAAAPGDFAQAGLGTPFSGLFTFTGMAHRGLVSDRQLASEIRARHFSLIALSFNLSKEHDPFWLNLGLTARMRRAIVKDYVLSSSLPMPGPESQRPHERFYFYVPRTGSTLPVRLSPKQLQKQ